MYLCLNVGNAQDRMLVKMPLLTVKEFQKKEEIKLLLMYRKFIHTNTGSH